MDVHLPGIESHECPVTAVTPESRAYLRLAGEATRIKETGAAFPSTQAGEWPAWWADVQDVVTIQQRIVEQAIDEQLR